MTNRLNSSAIIWGSFPLEKHRKTMIGKLLGAWETRIVNVSCSLRSPWIVTNIDWGLLLIPVFGVIPHHDPIISHLISHYIYYIP